MEVDASLLEREREIAALERLLDRARESRGAVVLIEGPAGIGKRVLCAELRRRLSARGAPVFEGVFGAGGGPYQAIRELVEATLARLGDRGE